MLTKKKENEKLCNVEKIIVKMFNIKLEEIFILKM